MTDVFNYIWKSIEFNNPNVYINSKNILKIGILPEEELKKQTEETPYKHERRNPSYIALSNYPNLTENMVNTSRVLTSDHLVYHYEGGWPKDLDITDENDKKKYIKKKIEKNSENQDRFTPCLKKMLETIEIILSQNNEIDMFENYFENEENQV